MDLEAIWAEGVRAREAAGQAQGSKVTEYDRILAGVQAVLRTGGREVPVDEIAERWHWPLLGKCQSTRGAGYAFKVMEEWLCPLRVSDPEVYYIRFLPPPAWDWYWSEQEARLSIDLGVEDKWLRTQMKQQYPSWQHSSSKYKDLYARNLGTARRQVMAEWCTWQIQVVAVLTRYLKVEFMPIYAKSRKQAKNMLLCAADVAAVLPNSQEVLKTQTIAKEILRRVDQSERYYQVKLVTIAQKASRGNEWIRDF